MKYLGAPLEQLSYALTTTTTTPVAYTRSGQSWDRDIVEQNDSLQTQQLISGSLFAETEQLSKIVFAFNEDV